jgi:hypothetical protein
VAEVHNFHRHQTTYDLTVGTLHTYYVLAGATSILVHNTSASLGANLRANGEYPTTPSPEAHHLVPENHRLATAARGILKNHGIDIDAAENGAWLGHNTHRATFTNDYVRWINDEIVNANAAGGESAVLDVLSSAKQTLQDLDLNFGNGL